MTLKKKLLIFVGIGIVTAFLTWWFFRPLGDGWLRKFFSLYELDPIFYLPAADTNALKEGLATVRRLDQEFIALALKQDDLSKTLLGEEERKNFQIHPLIFWGTLFETNDATARFFRLPNRWNAIRLLKSEIKAANAYRDDAAKIRIAYEKLVREKLDEPVMHPYFFNELEPVGVATPAVIRNDLLLIEKNGAALINEIKNRSWCLLAGRCSRLKLSVEAAEPLGKDERPPLADAFVYIKPAVGESEIRGPYWVPSPCFLYDEIASRSGEILSPLLILENSISGFEFLSTRLRTQIYFRPLTAVRGPLRQELNSSDLKKYNYLSVQPASIYRCNDLAYLSRLATIDAVHSMLKQKPNYVSDAEKSFAASREPSYSDLQALISSYESLLAQPQSLDASTGQQLKDIIRTFRAGDAQLNRIMNTLILAEGFSLWSQGVTPTTFEDLFTNYGYYSFWFLTFSASNWRIAEKPQYQMTESGWRSLLADYLIPLGATKQYAGRVADDFASSVRGEQTKSFSALKSVYSEETLLKIVDLTAMVYGRIMDEVVKEIIKKD